MQELQTGKGSSRCTARSEHGLAPRESPRRNILKKAVLMQITMRALARVIDEGVVEHSTGPIAPKDIEALPNCSMRMAEPSHMRQSTNQQ